MPTIKYTRDMEGAIKMNGDNYCWADCVLWQLTKEARVKRCLKKHPDLKARNFVMTMEDVRRPSKCGYCGNCMTEEEVKNFDNRPHTLEETANE